VSVNRFLFVEPQAHSLAYGSCVLAKTVSLNKQPNHVIAELKGENANPETITKTILSQNPTLCVMVGHGQPDQYTVECKTPYLNAGEPDLIIMKGRIIQMVSCLTAKSLGPSIIEAGALTYLGYREEFWFWIGTPPCSDRPSISPFLPDFEGYTASLMRGETTGEARLDQLRRYEEEINYWTFGEGKNHPHAAELARILEMNENASIFIGETTVSAATAAPTPTPTIITPSDTWKIPAIMALIASALLLRA
jgi:hypothetical protein